ncbi:MAG: hypothetical protein E3J72_06390 [Planctomycetota bacterium]|nr:MAG: hypothetical protein E3J72_06390 [Planctomycetota bacterium]
MKHVIIILFAVTFLACGCATTQVKIGRKISAADVNEIKIGKTTKTEILKKFGAPMTISIDPRGVEVYGFVELASDNHTWAIPPMLVIYIDGKASSIGKMLSVAFKDDIVRHWSYSVNSTMGAAEAGSTQGISGATLPDD